MSLFDSILPFCGISIFLENKKSPREIILGDFLFDSFSPRPS